MRIYIASRFKNSSENKDEIEKLCLAVRNTGMEDFHFIRDVEKYQPNFFKSQKELWVAALKYLNECDALLIDISDSPSGGRVVEVGMAYALGKPIYVIVKNGVEYKNFYDGIATAVFKYNEISDVTKHLKNLLNFKI
ncbi:MAG: nucleoside 2-deoxyribosyltransferase [Candidatus Saccharimonadales bacterium]